MAASDRVAAGLWRGVVSGMVRHPSSPRAFPMPLLPSRCGFMMLAAMASGPALAQNQAQTSSASPAPTLPVTAEDPVLARVDGEAIRVSDLAAIAGEVLPPEMAVLPAAALLQSLPPEVAGQLLDRAIAERAIVLVARRQGLDQDPVVRDRVRRAEEQELQQALLAREVAALVTDEAVRARYESDAAARRAEEEVRARHILLPTEAAARTALEELRRGADFATVARARSTDPGSREGGDLGFFKRGDMVAEFAEAAFALAPGQVSAAPVRTQFGWHVIRLEERRHAAAPPFEAARDQLRRQLMAEQVQTVVARIRGEARIERLDQPVRPSLLDGAAPPATPSSAAPPTTPSGAASPATRR